MDHEAHSSSNGKRNSNGSGNGNGNGKHTVNGKSIQERDNREQEMMSSQMSSAMAGNSGSMKPKPVCFSCSTLM